MPCKWFTQVQFPASQVVPEAQLNMAYLLFSDTESLFSQTTLVEKNAEPLISNGKIYKEKTKIGFFCQVTELNKAF